jgi:hypothetical protein
MQQYWKYGYVTGAGNANSFAKLSLPSFTFITVRQKLEKTFECYKYKESCL